jgi:AraC-like DNA-binding protein
MKIEDFIPTESLQPFIKTFRIIESQKELANRVLPNTSLAIAFRFSGKNSYSIDTGENQLPQTTFSGLRKSVRIINYESNTSTLIVLFKECGAAAFFKEPLHELFEASIPLDCIISPSEIIIIEELLSSAQTNEQRVAIVEQFLIKRMNGHKLDQLIAKAIEEIHFAKGFLKIKELADHLYISHDAFEKRFRKIVGTTPKQFSSIVRLSSIISQGQNNPNLLDIIFEAGYYDQSHFNKDFKQFTGQTPTDFLKSDTFW